MAQGARRPLRSFRPRTGAGSGGAAAELVRHRGQRHALSGGQREGLAQEADLLRLDQPAAGLDLMARRRIDNAL